MAPAELLLAALVLVGGPISALSSGAPQPAAAPAADFVLTGQFTQGGWIRGRAPADTTALLLNSAPLAMAADGSFFAGLDRDSGPAAELIARRSGLPDLRRKVVVSSRSWQIERINAPLRPPALPDADFARIRKGELARIAAARSTISDAAGWRQNFVWPLKGALRGRFGAQRIYRGTPGAYHAGLDISGATGTPFTAPADGVVTLAAAAPFTLEGNLLIIDHGAGLSSAFLHCSQLAVKPGDRVRQGQVLGWVGKTGRATGPHLHWALKWRDARLDPLLFVAPQG